MAENQTDPYLSPSPESLKDQTVKRKLFGFTAVEMLVITAILAILVALLLPAIQQTRGPHPRTTCRNNLKQIGLALHNYHDIYGTFPSAVIAGNDGRPAHSWRVLVLPYCGQPDLYDQYDFDRSWDAPSNITLQDKKPGMLHCWLFSRGLAYESPAKQHLERLSSYSLIVSPDGFFDGSRACSLNEAERDLSEILIGAEVRQHAMHWMSPVDVTPRQLLTDVRWSVSEEHANHPSGVMGLFADGSVRMLPHDISEEELFAMVSIRESEPGVPAE